VNRAYPWLVTATSDEWPLPGDPDAGVGARHHRVPRFYLERFANERMQITTVDRRTRTRWTSAIKETAAERLTCRNWAVKNTAPVSEAFSKKIAALPAEKPRKPNSRIGSIGARARSSHAMNATVSTAPAASVPTTSGLAQPAELPRTRPHSSPSAAAVASPRPGRSSAARGPQL
jgi:hypothetical protein